MSSRASETNVISVAVSGHYTEGCREATLLDLHVGKGWGGQLD